MLLIYLNKNNKKKLMQIVETPFFITCLKGVYEHHPYLEQCYVINCNTTSQYDAIMYTKFFTSPNLWCRIALEVLSK